ncbi:MAG: hypothetical protein JNJ73_06995 [Hyphomonadaceae bacterium]|nr:hypothetical protein [Hyphomonadaceae bacterium]
MNALRVLIGIAGLAVIGVAVWAAFAFADLHGDPLQQFGVIASFPWGVATLVNLLVGYVVFAAIVHLVEKGWWATAGWALPVLLFGNAWAALWVVVRLPAIMARLAPPAEPPPPA